MSLTKSELIEKLSIISSKYDKVCEIKEKIEKVVPEDNYERKVNLPPLTGKKDNEENEALLRKMIDHEDKEKAIEGIKILYEAVNKPPQMPEKPTKKEFKAPEKAGAIGGFRIFAGFLVAVAVFFLLGGFLGNVDEETQWTIPIIYTISGVSAISAGISFLVSLVLKLIYVKKEKEAKEEYDKAQKTLDDQYNEKLASYEKDLEAYEKERQTVIIQYLAWREIYLKHKEEEESIKAQLEKDRQSLVKEIERNELFPAQEELYQINDLITEEYLPAIDKITSLLRSGRADTLKEAINLYEDILFKERQLDLEREKEESRRQEESMRRQDEQRRHQEEMRFLEEQEYQRRQEEMYRRQEEERRHNEEMEELKRQARISQENNAREEARRKHQESVAMYSENRAIHRQCNSCALNGRCQVAFTRSNCASFRPK